MSHVKYGLYDIHPRVSIALDSYPRVPRLPPNRGFQALFIGSTCWLPPWAAPLQVKFQQDYFGASLARRPVPSASGCRAPDAGDQLHVASGACSPPLAAPELLTRLLQKGGKKKYLFLSGSIQAASPELNPSLLQSVRYQILQKVEHRKKKKKMCQRDGKLAPQWESRGLFCSQIKWSNRRDALPDQAPVLLPLLQAGSALGPRCEGAPAYLGTVRW